MEQLSDQEIKGLRKLLVDTKLNKISEILKENSYRVESDSCARWSIEDMLSELKLLRGTDNIKIVRTNVKAAYHSDKEVLLYETRVSINNAGFTDLEFYIYETKENV